MSQNSPQGTLKTPVAASAGNGASQAPASPCPYCKARPLGIWPGAVTCGAAECQAARLAERQAEYNAPAALCPFCNKKPLAQRDDIRRGAETCGGLDCRIKRVKAWGLNQGDSPPPPSPAPAPPAPPSPPPSPPPPAPRP